MQATLVAWKDAVPALGALIAMTSAIVALVVFNYTRRVNRRRATLDMVLKTFMDDAGKARYAAYKDLIANHRDPNNQINIMDYANPASARSKDKSILMDQLNEYELIALGIRRKLFDEAIYKLWFQGQFMRDFDAVSEYITKVREQRQSVYCEYVWLYNRWKKAPHPENAPSRFKKAWWGITGNDAKLKAFANSDAG